MFFRQNLEIILRTVGTASTSMEARFLEIGERLEIAIDVLGSLSRTFEQLSNEMRGDNLAEATQSLSQIMSQISGVAEAHTAGREAVSDLAALTAGLKRRVAAMSEAVAGIKMLAMNARIEAASIGNAGHEFVTFASDIGRTLRLAQTSLLDLNGELDRLGGELNSAAASQLALARLQATAAQSIPSRLDDSIAAIKERVQRAVATMSTVMEKSQQVGQHINKAVAALQIGDATRQRLEHIEYALKLAADILAPAHEPRHSNDGDWTMLTEAQRSALVVLCCHMQSAQLTDAADQLEQETRHVKASMEALTTDAREILQLGHAAAGGSGDHRGSFLGQIEEQVTDVSKLIDSLEKARQRTNHVTHVVADAMTRLADHTGALTSIEGDIRIMGLNTSLKCGRLGTIGRPLMVIAQELRTYANQIAVDANAVALSLNKMVQATESLVANGRSKGATDITGIVSVMGTSVTRLETAGTSLSDALGVLAHDAGQVSKLLIETVSRATGDGDMGDVMRQAADDLLRLIRDVADFTEPTAAEAEGLFDLLSRRYTMDREREVHNRNTGGRHNAILSHAAPSQAHAPAGDMFEDIFF